MMPFELEVTSATRIDDPGSYDGISHIAGSFWCHSVATAIGNIRLGSIAYYVERPAGQKAYLRVVSLFGREYVRTGGDGLLSNNLLSLPEYVGPRVPAARSVSAPQARGLRHFPRLDAWLRGEGSR
jgi:hypothetical protein